MLPFLGIQLLNQESCWYSVQKGSTKNYTWCLGHIFPMNVTIWRQYSHLWSSTKCLIYSTIKSFINSKHCDQQQLLSPSKEPDDTVHVILPFRDQISADIMRKQLKDLSLKVHTAIQPVFVGGKITFFRWMWPFEDSILIFEVPPNASFTLPSKVSLTQSIVISSNFCHPLKSQMTQFM